MALEKHRLAAVLYVKHSLGVSGEAGVVVIRLLRPLTMRGKDGPLMRATRRLILSSLLCRISQNLVG